MASTIRGAYEVTHRVEGRRVFESITELEIGDGRQYRRYAHHLARACWNGCRIMLRQTSPEAEGILSSYFNCIELAVDGTKLSVTTA